VPVLINGWWSYPDAFTANTRATSKQDSQKNRLTPLAAHNTAAQGYPVPLLYGRRRIGGAIISAGIYVEDQQ
jgi:predicted phage tail protein